MTVSAVAIDRPQALTPDEKRQISAISRPLGFDPVGKRGRELILRVLESANASDTSLLDRLNGALHENAANVMRDIDSIIVS